MTAPVAVLVCATAWATAGVVAAAVRRGAVRRRLAIPSRRRTADPLAALGRAISRPLAGPAGSEPGRQRRVGASIIAGVVGVAVHPVLGAGAVAAVLVPPLVRDRRTPRHQLDIVVGTLPDVVDLLGVAARAGLPPPAAVHAVAERAPPPWGEALQAVAGRSARGERFVDALDALAGVGGGDAAHPLRAVLRSAADDGDDLVAALDRLAADARELRRRRAEERARRVPVRLLLPLVACSLPAFALLTIVPILAGALRDLDL